MKIKVKLNTLFQEGRTRTQSQSFQSKTDSINNAVSSFWHLLMIWVPPRGLSHFSSSLSSVAHTESSKLWQALPTTALVLVVISWYWQCCCWAALPPIAGRRRSSCCQASTFHDLFNSGSSTASKAVPSPIKLHLPWSLTVPRLHSSSRPLHAFKTKRVTLTLSNSAARTKYNLDHL